MGQLVLSRKQDNLSSLFSSSASRPEVNKQQALRPPRTKVAQYREAYAHRAGHHIRLSAVCHVDLGSDSWGVPAPPLHRRTVQYFADMGDDEPGNDELIVLLSASATPSPSHLPDTREVRARGARSPRAPPSPSIVGTRIWPLSGYLCRHSLPPSPSLDTFLLPFT